MSDIQSEHWAAHVAGLRAPGWAVPAWPQLAPAQAKQAKPRWRLLSYSVLLPGMRLLKGHQAIMGDKKCIELIVNIFCFEWYQTCHVTSSAVSQNQSLSSHELDIKCDLQWASSDPAWQHFQKFIFARKNYYWARPNQILKFSARSSNNIQNNKKLIFFPPVLSVKFINQAI